MLPDRFKNFNLNLAGRGYMGKVAECTPPKVTSKNEEYRGGGMDAPVEMDVGMDALVMDFTMAGLEADVLAEAGKTDVDGTSVSLRGAFGSGTVSRQARIDAVGRIKEADLGTWKSGDNNEQKFTMTLVYYKLTVDGRVIHEIDVLGSRRVINGVDQLASQRRALGLSSGGSISIGVDIGGLSAGVNIGL